MSNYDPTLVEMRAHLDYVRDAYGGDEFDREEAIYFFARDYHTGQWSNLYEALSQSEFKPSPLATGADGFPAVELYHELVGEFTSYPEK